jgi:hypothetical protein
MLTIVIGLLASRVHGMRADFEATQETATTFLNALDDNMSYVMNKRESGKNCVRCKFGINLCCAPNICVKKTLRPDECMEIKVGK